VQRWRLAVDPVADQVNVTNWGNPSFLATSSSRWYLRTWLTCVGLSGLLCQTFLLFRLYKLWGFKMPNLP
jgi:hypothetical protein